MLSGSFNFSFSSVCAHSVAVTPKVIFPKETLLCSFLHTRVSIFWAELAFSGSQPQTISKVNGADLGLVRSNSLKSEKKIHKYFDHTFSCEKMTCYC